MTVEQTVSERGREIYDSRLRAVVESGDYEISDDLLIAGKRLRERRPDAKIYGRRIGYNAVYAIGGSLVRTG